MVPPWLNIAADISLALSGGCALLIAADLVRHPQKMAVMNVTWPLTGLYLGVIGLWAYLAFGRVTREGDKPFWQSVFVGATHCGGGCTLGDGIAEWGIYSLGWTIGGVILWAEYAADLTLAYLFGIAFQYAAIAPMRDGPPSQALWAAVKADTLSLIAFEVGMFAWMALTYFVFFRPHLTPTEPTYWFMMQIAMIVGFATTYPMNWWLIKKGIKETM